MAKDMKKEKNYGAGKSRLPFSETPAIGGQDEGKKVNKSLDTSMFGDDALKSDIATTPDYSAGSKKEYFQPGKGMEDCLPYIEENEISPTSNY